MVAASELPININASATAMAQEIMGDGVTVVGATYTGDRRSSGIFSDGDNTSPGATPSDTGVILSTGRARDFTNSTGQSNQSTNTSFNSRGENNNADFNAAAGTNTYDASYIEIDFIPTGDVMTMQFVFSSEEYPEYVNSIYQDTVLVMINGVEVPMAVGNGDTDPGNVNATTNQNLFIDNTTDAYNTEMDGFTVTMTLTIPVNAGVVNSILIGIADVGDSSYDSNLLIAGNSVQTALVAQDDMTHLLGTQTKTIDVLSNDIGSGTLTITHINGQAVVAGDTITLNTGQTVTLNADGTFTLVGDGTNESFNFTYGVDNGTNQDTGYVLVDAVPCFVAGSRIETRRGPRAVETLQAGEWVRTQDHGWQELRWIGRRRVLGQGEFAPIRIAAGTFGGHGILRVSPLHRILVRGAMPELLFGDSEVLVAARDLVDGRDVRVEAMAEVTYVHLLFDRHEIVFAEGLASESFLPGPQLKHSFEADMVGEIAGVLPGFDAATGAGYGPAARRILKKYEAELLLTGPGTRRAA